MIADIVFKDPIYVVKIYRNNINTEWFEVLHEHEIDVKLKQLGFFPGEIKYHNNGWVISLDNKPVKENKYNGYGFVFDHNHVSEVMGCLTNGYSKRKDYSFPAPETKLNNKSISYDNVYVYQNKDHYSVWSTDKIKLDVMRKKIIEWRRNHQFKIERFV